MRCSVVVVLIAKPPYILGGGQTVASCKYACFSVTLKRRKVRILVDVVSMEERKAKVPQGEFIHVKAM